MKPLRYLHGVVLELVTCGLAGLIVYLPLFKLLDWLYPRIPYAVRTGPWGDVLSLIIQIPAFACFIAVDLRLHILFWSLSRPDKGARVSCGRKPPVQPVRTVSAVVLDKSVRTKQRPRSRPEHQYFAGFQLEEGTVLWLSVTPEQHRKLAKGSRGQLTVRDKTCLCFQPEGAALYPQDKTQT